MFFFVGGSGIFPFMHVPFLVIFGFLGHPTCLVTWFIICLFCLLTSLHIVISFPWDSVGGIWDLIFVSVPDRRPLQSPI